MYTLKTNLPKAIDNLVVSIKKEVAKELVKSIKGRIQRGVPPVTKYSSKTPLFRTGKHLRDSIQSKTTDKQVEVYSDFPGAALLNYGGIHRNLFGKGIIARFPARTFMSAKIVAQEVRKIIKRMTFHKTSKTKIK